MEALLAPGDGAGVPLSQVLCAFAQSMQKYASSVQAVRGEPQAELNAEAVTWLLMLLNRPEDGLARDASAALASLTETGNTEARKLLVAAKDGVTSLLARLGKEIESAHPDEAVSVSVAAIFKHLALTPELRPAFTREVVHRLCAAVDVWEKPPHMATARHALTTLSLLATESGLIGRRVCCQCLRDEKPLIGHLMQMIITGAVSEAERAQPALDLLRALSDASAATSAEIRATLTQNEQLDFVGNSPMSACKLDERRSVALQMTAAISSGTADLCELKHESSGAVVMHEILVEVVKARMREASDTDRSDDTMLEEYIVCGRWLSIDASVFGAARAKLKNRQRIAEERQRIGERKEAVAVATGQEQKAAVKKVAPAKPEKKRLPNRGAGRKKADAETKHLPAYLQTAAPPPEPAPEEEAPAPAPEDASAAGWNVLRGVQKAAAASSAFQQPVATNAAEDEQAGAFASLLMRGKYGAIGHSTFSWMRKGLDQLSESFKKSAKKDDAPEAAETPHKSSSWSGSFKRASSRVSSRVSSRASRASRSSSTDVRVSMNAMSA